MSIFSFLQLWVKMQLMLLFVVSNLKYPLRLLLAKAAFLKITLSENLGFVERKTIALCRYFLYFRVDGSLQTAANSTLDFLKNQFYFLGYDIPLCCVSVDVFASYEVLLLRASGLRGKMRGSTGF
jgi:hypothetical protein